MFCWFTTADAPQSINTSQSLASSGNFSETFNNKENIHLSFSLINFKNDFVKVSPLTLLKITYLKEAFAKPTGKKITS